MMHLTIKNKAARTQKLPVETYKLNPEDLLAHVDIVAAIDYYGVTELLDLIGEDEIRAHLQNETDNFTAPLAVNK